MNLRTAGQRGSPAIIGRQLGEDNLQATVIRVTAADGGPQLRLTGRRAHRRAHRTPGPQERRDQLRANISRPAGDQDRSSSQHLLQADAHVLDALARHRLPGSVASITGVPQRRLLAQNRRWTRRVAISASMRSA